MALAGTKDVDLGSWLIYFRHDGIELLVLKIRMNTSIWAWKVQVPTPKSAGEDVTPMDIGKKRI